MSFQTKLLEERKIVNNGFLGEVIYLEDKELNEDDIDLLENVKKIHFCPDFDKSIDDLPDNLTEIYIKNLKELNKLPKKLKVFKFHYIKKINNSCFLNTNLKKLIFTNNCGVRDVIEKYVNVNEYNEMLKNIFENNIPSTLEEIIFDFNLLYDKHYKKNIKFSNLPVNLKNMKCLININTSYLPNKLSEIEIKGSYKNTLFLPSSLKKVSGCFSTNLPNKLKDITCNCFPNKIKIPKNALKVKLFVKQNSEKKKLTFNINTRGECEQLCIFCEYMFKNIKLGLFANNYEDLSLETECNIDTINTKIINKTEKNISVQKINFKNCDIKNDFENIDFKNIMIQIGKNSKFTKYNLDNVSVDNLTINDCRNVYFPYIIPLSIKNVIIKTSNIQTDINVIKQYRQINNISEIWKYGRYFKTGQLSNLFSKQENLTDFNFLEINSLNEIFSKFIDNKLQKCKHYCNKRYKDKIKYYNQNIDLCFNEIELNKGENIMLGYIDILFFIDVKFEDNITIIETREEEFKEYLLYLIKNAKTIKNRVENSFNVDKNYVACEILYLLNGKIFCSTYIDKIYNLTKSYKKNHIIGKEYCKCVEIVKKYCDKEFELMKSKQFNVKLCVE